MVRVALIKSSALVVVKEQGRPKYPCLGLAYISAVLKAEKAEVLVIDASFDGMPFNEIEASVIKFRPQILGFTAMTHEIIHVANVAEKLKRSVPSAKIIIGGPHATVAAAMTLKEFPVFDIAVIGEGEETFKEIIKEMSLNSTGTANAELNISHERLNSIRGIAWRFGQNIKLNEKRELIKDLDSLPFPNYDHISRNIRVYPIFSSRGCPNNCIFCCRVMGNKIRLRSPESVVNEMKYALEKIKPELFDFADETFTFPKERTIKICDLIIKQGINKIIKWSAQSRVTLVNQQLFDKMKQAGCINVDFGVETGNQDVLKRIRKGITLEDASKAVEAAKKAGLKTGSYFILGHPFETTQTMTDTIEFASKINTDFVSFGIMVPYPGTEVYEMAIHGEGKYRIISENWTDYDKQFGNALELVDLNREQLEKWQHKAYINFYLKNLRLLDLIRLTFTQRKLLWRMLTKSN